jgi:hypothetical protein
MTEADVITAAVGGLEGIALAHPDVAYDCALTLGRMLEAAPEAHKRELAERLGVWRDTGVISEIPVYYADLVGRHLRRNK